MGLMSNFTKRHQDDPPNLVLNFCNRYSLYIWQCVHMLQILPHLIIALYNRYCYQFDLQMTKLRPGGVKKLSQKVTQVSESGFELMTARH